jgi:hypothetical protein
MQLQVARENRKRVGTTAITVSLHPELCQGIGLWCGGSHDDSSEVGMAGWKGSKKHLMAFISTSSRCLQALELLDLGPLQSQIWKEICKKGHNAVFEMWYVGCNHGVNSGAYSILCMELLQVVPTVYTDIRGRRIVSNQVCLVICCPELFH